MIEVDDRSRSLIAFEQISTLVIVVELSQSSWLAAGVVPGIERRPLKKLDPDPTALLHLVEGWRDRTTKAGRDGFWLARWLRVRGVETFVMHSTRVAVSREPRRAKTDLLDTEMLISASLGSSPPRVTRHFGGSASGRRGQLPTEQRSSQQGDD
jgi:transposase